MSTTPNPITQSLRLWVAILLGLGLATTVRAAWQEGSLNPELAEAQTMSGEVASLDLDEHLLMLKTGLFSRERFVLDEHTTISDGARELGAEALEPGMAVTVEYIERADQRIATMVTIDEATAESPSASSPSQTRASQM